MYQTAGAGHAAVCMPPQKEGEGASHKPTEPGKQIQKAPATTRVEELATPAATEQEAFAQEFWNTFIEKASVIPVGEDPAFWPALMLAEFRDVIAEREHIRDAQKREYIERLAAMKDTLREVETAYKIIAYPHCTERTSRKIIGTSLETDRQAYGRDQVTLTDAELDILRRICETPRYALTVDESGRQKEPVAVPLPKLPFNPQQRVYSYASVPVPPFVDPYQRRHLSTEEIRTILANEQAQRKK